MAKLLGFESYSHYKLDTEMAASPENVEKLLKKVWGPAREVAIRDEALLTSMMRDDGVNDTLKVGTGGFMPSEGVLKNMI